MFSEMKKEVWHNLGYNFRLIANIVLLKEIQQIRLNTYVVVVASPF